MKTYQVEVCETSARLISVEADDAADALDIVRAQYNDGEIVLGDNDYQDVDFIIQ